MLKNSLFSIVRRRQQKPQVFYNYFLYAAPIRFTSSSNTIYTPDTLHQQVKHFLAEHKFQDAYALYNENKEKVKLDSSLFTILINNSDSIQDAESIMNDIGKLQISYNIILCNSMLNAYLRRNLVDHALAFVATMQQKYHVTPSLITFNALIHYYVSKNQVAMAEQIFEAVKKRYLLQPDQYTFNSMILGRAAERNMLGVEELIQAMIQSKVPVDQITLGCILDSLSQDATFALQQFNYLRTKYNIVPSDVNYMLLIHGLTKAGQPRTAMDVLKSAVCAMTDVRIYNSIMSAFAKKRDEKGAQQVLQLMKEHNIAHDIVTMNSLLECYIQCDKMEQALELFEKLKQEGITKPDTVTYCTIMNGHAKLGKIKQVEQLYEEMLSKKIPVNAYIYTTILCAYVESDKKEKVLLWLSEWAKSDVPFQTESLTVVIQACSKQGQHDNVIHLLDMLKQTKRLDRLTIHSVFKVYAEEAAHQALLPLMYLMEKRYDIVPDLRMYQRVFQSLKGTLNHQIAAKLLKEMQLHKIALDSFTRFIVENIFFEPGRKKKIPTEIVALLQK